MNPPATRPPGDDLTTRVYLALLRMTTPRRSEVLKHGFSEGEAATALLTLEARGLIDGRRRDIIEVFPPETALPSFAADLERQARSTRAAIDGLSHMFYESRAAQSAPRTSPGVSLLETVEDIEAAFFRAAAKAQSRIVRLAARSDRMDRQVILHAESLMSSGPETSQPALERLVVFEQSILEVDGAFSALETMRADGIEVRLTPHLAFSVLAVDRVSAVIDISHLEASDGGSLQVRQPQLASALMDMCVGLFALASPLPRTPQGPALGRLTDRDAQILALLASGSSDSIIARQLGISQRTVERRVRMIMEELGASTRFQAGTTAVRRGLL